MVIVKRNKNINTIATCDHHPLDVSISSEQLTNEKRTEKFCPSAI
jgi:hypothetical protein